MIKYNYGPVDKSKKSAEPRIVLGNSESCSYWYSSPGTFLNAVYPTKNMCSEVSKGIAQVSLASSVPVMFGVLTTDTIEQAIERAGTKSGNKGFDCATGAIEMVNLLREIRK